jgi:hypothetical protein
MPNYVVAVREVHIAYYDVSDASDPVDAIKAVKERRANTTYVEGALEYSHELDSSTWSVEDEEGQVITYPLQ